MTKNEQIAENDGAAPATRPTTGNLPEAPVYMTRREAREAERRAEAERLAAEGAPLATAAETEPATAPAPAAAPAADTAPSVATPAAEAQADDASADAFLALPTVDLPASEGSVRPVRVGRSTRSSTAVRTVSRESPRSGRRASSSAHATSAAAASVRGGSSFGRTTKKVTAVGAMLFAGAMLVATSLPANAFFVDTPAVTAAKKSAGAQSFIADGPAVDGDVSRDGYSVTEQVKTAQYASNSASTFSNDVNGTVQWPFQSGVPISSGFGARQVANCSFCSTFHEGLDFVPGAGSPIQSIADGVVQKVDGPSGALGNNVWIEHTVNGQKVVSVYAHMQTGSVTVKKGDSVTVGEIIGKVGSTGNSTGAHLHFEIVINSVPVDPYPWLVANTN